VIGTLAQAFPIPALRKVREGLGTHSVGNASEIKSLATRPILLPLVQQIAILRALHGLHLDFRFLVRNVSVTFRHDHQRLPAVPQIHIAAEVERLDSPLLARSALQSRR
jgi:hypothetical protein